MENDLSTLDLVYPLRSVTSSCEDLRYSLRSACKNLPHRGLCIVGTYLPRWLDESKIYHLPVGDPYYGEAHKAQNTCAKLREVCEDPRISDPFILMNDDFFALQEINDIPFYSWGEMYKHLNTLICRHNDVSHYMRILLDAAVFLSDCGYTTYDFGIHAPIIVDKRTMLKVLSLREQGIYCRTLYANIIGAEPTIVDDFKYNDLSEHIDFNKPFASTSDESFDQGVAGQDLRARFKYPCEYEKRGM